MNQINRNQIITLSNAAYQLEQYEEGSAAFLAADVDENGTIESSDARTILRVSVKLETF